MQLDTYDFNMFPVRVALVEGEPWFVLGDVCRALSLSNPSMVAQRLQPQQLTKLNLGSRQGETIFISESGLYRTVLRSDSPSAEPFQVWVTEDILPNIRKTGGYSVAPAMNMSDPIVLAQQFIEAETARRALAVQVETLTPKAQAFDALMESDGTYSVSNAAKILGLGLGRDKLFELLRQRGILMDRKNSGKENHNVPYQKYLDAHYFKVDTKAAPDGIHVSRTTRVTTRGLAWLQTRLSAHLALPAPSSPPAQQHMA